MKAEVYKGHKCEGGLAELWVGYHPIYSDEQNVWIDHAKIWVMISTSKSLPDSRWKDLSPEKVPLDYEGDRNCVKFFSLGSGFVQGEIKGQVNEEGDLTKDLLGAVQVKTGFDPSKLLTDIDKVNLIIDQNFANSSLKRWSAFPQDWNYWGFDWDEFNGNGYISGFLNYLMKAEGNEEGQESKPLGGNVDGWEKDIPIELFQKVYSKDEVRKVTDNDHFPDWRPEEETKGETQTSSTGEETQQLSSLDP